MAANLKKRRGAQRGSVTRLESRVTELEGIADQPRTAEHAQQILTKLRAYDEAFRDLHFQIVDSISEEDETSLENEQGILDKFDDDVANLTLRVEALISRPTPDPTRGLVTVIDRRPLNRKLARLESGLNRVDTGISDPEAVPERVQLNQFQEEISDYKKDLAALYEDLVTKDIDDDDALFAQHSQLERKVSSVSQKLKVLLATPSATPAAEATGIKLPKLEVPTFDGNLIHWKQFWDQFATAVHSKTNLSSAEKIVYLQQALKDATAKSTIEGLAHSGDNYEEAVRCLKARYDRPRLIQRSHVQAIVDAPSLKNGGGKELRKLHDNLQQHIRALGTLGCDLPGTFVTSLIELKLDVDTLFEWQKHSQDESDVPDYEDLLNFIDLRAQASETSCPSHKKPFVLPHKTPFSRLTSHVANTESENKCIVCGTEKHPLYLCARFKAMSHESKRQVLKTNRLCNNCLGGGHFKAQCKSAHRCRVCQKAHHTLLHADTQVPAEPKPPDPPGTINVGSTPAATGLQSNLLLMTCRVLIKAPDDTFVEARALLDNGSCASFISERLATSLSLRRKHVPIRVSGIGGLSHKPPLQSVTTFEVRSLSGRGIEVTAVIVPKVTCELPTAPVAFDLSWSHISDIPLADPGFGQPGRIDVLLGADVFVDILRDGRRKGPENSPTAFETDLGWVLCGSTGSSSLSTPSMVATFHTSVEGLDDTLRKFWEMEELPSDESSLSATERLVVRHFECNHRRSKQGRFIVPLPKNPSAGALGESRAQAVKRFLSLEHSLNRRDRFQEFDSVMQEYIDVGHAEVVPTADLEKPPGLTFYLPMHAVYKASSTTTKVRAVFDASAKTSTGVSLNDTLLVGPTVHPKLLDVLLRFRMYPVALTADVSKMYRAIELVEADKDLHRFLWRSNRKDYLVDYRMTRVTFGVSASSFAANMAVKQNAINHSLEFPEAAEVVFKSFYVDDCLTGAEDSESALLLQRQLIELFSRGGFTLRKWNSNDCSVLQQIPPALRDSKEIQVFTESDEYTKTLGIAWNVTSDQLHISVNETPPGASVTKRSVVSGVARVFDALGFLSPVTIKMKILLQRLWELKLDWDEPVPQAVEDMWNQWRRELPCLTTLPIPRCYRPKEFPVTSIQLHGFSDASEDAYAGVVYLRLTSFGERVHTALVTSKTKVSPIKRISIPRLELCGAHVLAKLLHHVRKTLGIPTTSVFAWTDSTVVLSWLCGSPRRFKTYVGNRVSHIIDQLPPERWGHVPGVENPADCASRGVFPLELKDHQLWWNGPHWLQLEPSHWPTQSTFSKCVPSEEKTSCNLGIVETPEPVIPLSRYSSFTRLKRVSAWILRFIENVRVPTSSGRIQSTCLTVSELTAAENYWLRVIQRESFPTELDQLRRGLPLPKNSRLLHFRPLWDKDLSVLRVGGRLSNSELSFSQSHPVILEGRHPVTKLLIQSEHVRLMHAGASLLQASLSQRFHIVGARRAVRLVTRQCITCRRHTVKPQGQLLGQLPSERVSPATPFERTGVDYAGPFLTKYGKVRKPTVVKTYICLFVCLAVKAIHLELVSDLTAEAFIAAFRRFISRRGCPSLMWSDHGSNFVGAKGDLKEMYQFLSDQITQGTISNFCASNKIEWRFIPEKSPHFGGIWESNVKSVKAHLKRIVSPVKLTFEEFTTVLAQVEAILNSRPLAPTDSPDDDGISVLTPGHFLIGKPLASLPDPEASYRTVSLLKRWHLCQNLVRHFWERWSKEYLCILNKYHKWRFPVRNVAVGDVVILQEQGMVPTKWPLGRVKEVYPGRDGLVRVVSVKTPQGIYRRPVAKVAVLIPNEDN